ncbi:unnamed protein product [Echinostoma caproni]|uniref:Septin-type G domain-containing protein n=1 Tax=Echinostoma caproni TaxID=27848 RepID=A0A183BF59_9TREM|nr:unnamed protein product [Echinostoma caproni]
MGKDNPIAPMVPAKDSDKLSTLKASQVPSEPYGDTPQIVKRTLITTSQVGFVSLPDQLHRKAVRRGFDFNLMITGSPGLGKSSFINALFCSDVYNTEYPLKYRWTAPCMILIITYIKGDPLTWSQVATNSPNAGRDVL